MNGYYEPHTCLQLSRPIVLAGQIGSGTRLVARALSARTGLPFVEIDRQIEHEAGRSLARLAADEGVGRMASWARSVLERLSLQRPWSVMVLDRAWPTLESKSLLRRRVDFVRIRRPHDYLLDRLEKEVSGEHRWVLEAHATRDPGLSGLDMLVAHRDSLLQEAGVVLDAGAQHELEVASILLEALEPVIGAKRI